MVKHPLPQPAPSREKGEKRYNRPHRPRQDNTESPRMETAPENIPAEAAEAESSLQPGIKPVTELLRQNPEKVDTVFIRKGRKDKESNQIIDLCREGGVRFSLVDDAFLQRLWRGRHQGVIARTFPRGFTDFEDLLSLTQEAPLPLILALDQVQDPGNAGTLARTLYALGGAGILVPKHNGVYLGAAAARVSAGALDKLPVSKVPNIAQALSNARDAGFTIYGAEAASGNEELLVESAFNFKAAFPAVLVLGSEQEGLRPLIKRRCHKLLAVPFLREFNSLNVAQAGGILISAFAAALGEGAGSAS